MTCLQTIRLADVNRKIDACMNIFVTTSKRRTIVMLHDSNAAESTGEDWKTVRCSWTDTNMVQEECVFANMSSLVLHEATCVMTCCFTLLEKYPSLVCYYRWPFRCVEYILSLKYPELRVFTSILWLAWSYLWYSVRTPPPLPPPNKTTIITFLLKCNEIVTVSLVMYHTFLQRTQLDMGQFVL